MPLKKENTYLDRLFTTGVVGYQGATHIADRPAGGTKDFSALIAKAKMCPPPVEIETGTIVGGFAHHQVLALADKVVAAVKSGAIKRFVVMAGCAKYRYNTQGDMAMQKWRCVPCDYVYDPEKGDPENGIAPGTAFEDLPEDWVCPECSAGKDMFEKVE